MGVIMKLVSKLLLIFFMLGLVSVCLPQKVLAVSDEGITSFQLYQPKANQGDADAQFNLALLYYTGLGIPQDRRYAIYWYTKAAEQNHHFAKEDRDKMLEKMSQSQIEEVQKLSKELYEKIHNKAK
jgi:hypothetical protein